MKNMHGVNIQSEEERLNELQMQIREQLAVLAELNNNADAPIDRTSVELSTLHVLFARKHTIMRIRRKGRMDLDRFAQKEAPRDALA